MSKKFSITKLLFALLTLFVISCGENKCEYLGDISNFQGTPQSINKGSWLQTLPLTISDRVIAPLFGSENVIDIPYGKTIKDIANPIEGAIYREYFDCADKYNYLCDTNYYTITNGIPLITKPSGIVGLRSMTQNQKQLKYKQDDPSTHSSADLSLDKDRGTVYNIYAGIIRSTEYRVTYYLGLTLYITILGLTYLLGMTQLTVQKSLPIFIRIGIISLFTNPILSSETGMPIGWSVYYTAIVGPSVYAMEAFAMYFSSNLFDLEINQVENGFAPIAIMLSFLFNDIFWIKATTLIFSSAPIGFATFIILFMSLAIYLISAFLSIMTYVVVISTLGVLFAIGPIFFIFLLFEKTKQFFDKWWKQILALMLQQYTLFIAISVFGFIILSAAQSIMSFPVSCKHVISLNLLPSFCPICYDIPLFAYYVADLGEGTGTSLAMSAIFLWMLTAIYAKSIQSLADFGGSIVGSGTAPIGGGALSGTTMAWDKASKFISDRASITASNVNLHNMTVGTLSTLNNVYSNTKESFGTIKEGYAAVKKNNVKSIGKSIGGLTNIASGVWGLTGGNAYKGLIPQYFQQHEVQDKVTGKMRNENALDQITGSKDVYNDAKKNYNELTNKKQDVDKSQASPSTQSTDQKTDNKPTDSAPKEDNSQIKKLKSDLESANKKISELETQLNSLKSPPSSAALANNATSYNNT